jgi:hypothetical protein
VCTPKIFYNTISNRNVALKEYADGNEMKKTALIFLFLVLILIGAGLIIRDRPDDAIGEKSKLTETIVLRDDFNEGYLNPESWQITQQGDFKERVVDSYDVDPSENSDYRLRLRMNTLGTRDDTVKYQGVRSVGKVDFSAGKEISFDLDWNNQSNGCYLSASIYLCPTVTNGNPGEENDWLKYEYVGVPPGRNARCVVATKTDGKVKYLYTEGWPEQQTGRHIGYQRITIIVDNRSIKISENENEIYHTPSPGLEFTSAYLYLQMSSHSNYPTREIYYDNVVVSNSG